MGISGAQSCGQRLQGLVPTTDISVCRIGDLASPTEHRMPRQNDGLRHPGSSAYRHVRVRSRSASTLGVGQYAARSKAVGDAVVASGGRVIGLPAKVSGGGQSSGVGALPATFHPGLRSRSMSNGGTIPITNIPPRTRRA